MIKKNLKPGTKCVIIANNARHNRPIGSVVTITTFYNNGGYNDSYQLEEFPNQNFYRNDLELWEQSGVDLKKELSEMVNKISKIEEKINYLSETSREVVNPDEFKTYKLNKIIADESLSSEEKTQLIMEFMGEGKKPKKVKMADRPKVAVSDEEEMEEETEMVDEAVVDEDLLI